MLRDCNQQKTRGIKHKNSIRRQIFHFLSWIKPITNEVFLNPTVNMLAYETLESVFDPFSILLPASSCTLYVGGEK